MILLTVAKIIVTVLFVVGLSLVAERISTRWAGILSGYPTGTAIALFFFGFEVSPQFAADSVTYNIVGLIATFSFTYIYYRYSQRHSIFLTVLAALLGYGIVVTILRSIPFTKTWAVVAAVVAIIIFSYLLKNIENVVIQKRIKLSLSIIMLRGLAAAVIILIITGAAHLVGHEWSGLFSSFPTTLLPLMLIIHLTYGKEQVHTIIKNVPIGNVAIILYSLTIALTYPTVGIYAGTILSFAVATLYLFCYQAYQKQRD